MTVVGLWYSHLAPGDAMSLWDVHSLRMRDRLAVFKLTTSDTRNSQTGFCWCRNL